MFRITSLFSLLPKCLLTATTSTGILCASSSPAPANMKDKAFIQNEQKELNIYPVHQVDTPFEKATFGMGCFWGAEALYGGTNGVLRTRVGYAGGTTKSPTYHNIGDHTEVLEIDYDPQIITFHKLLHLFWNHHEYGLCTKIKRQYMSLILYHNEEQKNISIQSKTDEQTKRKPEVVTTVIQPASTFYPAEDYHQKYRLQSHKDLVKTLELNSDLLRNSYVATKLNGYLVGVGGEAAFLKDVNTMGLTPSQQEYIHYYVKKNEGAGLYC